jgi:hypothetical protein
MRGATRWARAPGHGNKPPAILTFVSEMTFVRLLDGMALFALMILHVRCPRKSRISVSRFCS